ncbi:hypothetical protein HK103_005603 [Boothiomyces macroporosus]|uniref:HECT-type E3 ubiquitin transferase n=1 Tax=Boothiomyces macroporosus TaxID=261099 RepID=A0AAD5UHT8_9FUNG|nr:hypothetical protein HK103_005603 [Boothiomyces macroporosus]
MEGRRSRSSSIQKALNDPRLSASLTDVSKNNSSRPQFELKITRYFYQLIHGCGKNCTTKNCASNPKYTVLRPEIAAVYAIQMASSNLPFCSNLPAEIHFNSPFTTPVHSRQSSFNSPRQRQNSTGTTPFLNSIFSHSPFQQMFSNPKSHSLEKFPRSKSTETIKSKLSSSSLDLASDESIDDNLSLKELDYHLFKIAVDNYHEDHEPTFLLNSIALIFSNLEALGKSFRFEGERIADIDLRITDSPVGSKHPSKMEINEITLTYELIGQLEEMFCKAMMEAIETQIAKLQLKNPLFQRPEYASTLCKFCELLVKLKSQARLVLINWFVKLPEKEFQTIVQVFKSFICTTAINEDGFIGGIKMLSMLSHSNEMEQKMPPAEFYALELYPKLNFKDEYKRWKKSLAQPVITEFAVFNYPFLFDPVAKNRIMHIDAMVKMSHEYEDACVNQALVLNAMKFLDDSALVQTMETEMKESVNPYFILEVRRTHLIADVLDQIVKKSVELKKPLKVKFVGGGEEGMDQGGVQKEFFQILIEKLMDPDYGMFEYNPETRQSWINRNSLESSLQFELVGIVIGLALYNGVMVRVSFPKIMYKKLVKEEITLEDVKEAFPSLGKGLQQLLDWHDGDVSDVFMRTFEISYERFGKVEHIPLMENGQDILVTNENREKYVLLYIKHLCYTSIQDQFNSFRQGFYKVCGGQALKMCRSFELEQLICGKGTSELDFKDLQEGAQYEEYTSNHEIITWFWEIVHEMDLQQKQRLLEFVTASDRIPLKGLQSLVFVIQRNGPDTDRLPSALTCFGRLLLPEYSSRDKLAERLLTAIDNAKGFGLV